MCQSLLYDVDGCCHSIDCAEFIDISFIENQIIPILCDIRFPPVGLTFGEDHHSRHVSP